MPNRTISLERKKQPLPPNTTGENPLHDPITEIIKSVANRAGSDMNEYLTRGGTRGGLSPGPFVRFFDPTEDAFGDGDTFLVQNEGVTLPRYPNSVNVFWSVGETAGEANDPNDIQYPELGTFTEGFQQWQGNQYPYDITSIDARGEWKVRWNKLIARTQRNQHWGKFLIDFQDAHQNKSLYYWISRITDFASLSTLITIPRVRIMRISLQRAGFRTNNEAMALRQMWFDRYTLRANGIRTMPSPSYGSPTGFDETGDDALSGLFDSYRGLADPDYQPSNMDPGTGYGIGGGGDFTGRQPEVYDQFSLTGRRRVNSAADILAYMDYTSANGTALDTMAITDKVRFDFVLKCNEIAKNFPNLGIPDIEKFMLDSYYEDFEVCNFQVPSYYVRNNHTFENLDGYGEPGQDISFGMVNPEYNYFFKAYEEGIGDPELPEAVLPNMYIYSLLQKEGDLEVNRSTTLGWQNQRDQNNFREVQNNYDKLVRMGEFIEGTLPVMAGEPGFLQKSDQYQSQFRHYLNQYSMAVAESVTVLDVDMLGDLAKNYYNLYTTAGSMSLYDKLNYKKTQFPMYIETWIPTLPVRTVAGMIERLQMSTVALNSLNRSNSSIVPFKCSTQAFCSPEDYVDAETDNADRTRMYESSYRQNGFRGELQEESIQMDESCVMYDAADWIAGLLEEVEGTPLGVPEGNETMPDRCLELQQRVSVQTLQNLIETEAQRNIISYQEYMLNDGFLLHEPETIAYRLVKKQASDGKTLQVFHFPNTSKEAMIKFVDTQVKYNKEYRYEVYGFALVYGTKFRFRTISARTEIGTITRQGIDGQTISDTTVVNSPYSHFNVQSLPNPKIVQYPIFTHSWRNSQRRYSNALPWVTAGASLQDVKILDRPPMPPDLQIIPYRNEPTKVLIMSSNGMGQMLRENAVPFVALGNAELSRMYTLGEYQNKFEYYDLSSPSLEFKSEGSQEIARIDIYRTTQEPSENLESFGTDPYRSLALEDPDPENPMVNTEAFDFCDDLLSNTVYYYMARTLDYHGNYSNPSPIYQVELVYNSGVYYPLIDLYQPKEETTGVFSRRFARFLQAQASEIQSMVSIVHEEGNVVAKKGFVQDTATKVQNNNFIVRVTSIDTGRKLDFKLEFEEKTTIDEQ